MRLLAIVAALALLATALPTLAAPLSELSTSELASQSSGQTYAASDSEAGAALTNHGSLRLISLGEEGGLETFPAAQPQRWKFFGPLAGCDPTPTRVVYALFGYDTWRSVADDSWQNNGLHAGLNGGTRLGKLSEWTGIGLQAGGTFGVYDWLGTDYRTAHQNDAQTQGFLTFGLFRHATAQSRWSAAVVQDTMFNFDFGVFGQNPTLGQLRGQVGYATSATNDFGLWGTVADSTATRDVPGFGVRRWRAVNQLNLYWHHKWGLGGADTWIWAGAPEQRRLSGQGSLGDYIAGALAVVPLSDRVGMYSLVTYMHASSSPSPAGSLEDAWNFSIGVTFYPRAAARSTDVCGRCWAPLMPVANNGYFLVDTNRTY